MLINIDGIVWQPFLYVIVHALLSLTHLRQMLSGPSLYLLITLYLLAGCQTLFTKHGGLMFA